MCYSKPMSPDYLMTALYLQVGTACGVLLYVAGKVFYNRKKAK